jgi:hypothetical protein
VLSVKEPAAVEVRALSVKEPTAAAVLSSGFFHTQREHAPARV